MGKKTIGAGIKIRLRRLEPEHEFKSPMHCLQCYKRNYKRKYVKAYQAEARASGVAKIKRLTAEARQG